MKMKKMMIMGMATIIAAAGMAGCGNTETADTASGEAAATTTTTAAAAPAAPADSPAETTAAGSEGGNEFLDNLNKQMDNFEENVGKVTVESGAGTAETAAAAESPAEPQTTQAAAEAPAEITTAAPVSSPELDSNELLASLGERVRVGSKEYGFIDVPVNWHRFREEGVPEGEMLQYSNGIGSEVITMRRYQYMVAQQVADRAYDALEADPSAEITSSCKCEIEGRSAFRIDVKYKSDLGQDMTVWTVQGDDSYTYYLAVEYLDPAVFELARTFSLEK